MRPSTLAGLPRPGSQPRKDARRARWLGVAAVVAAALFLAACGSSSQSSSTSTSTTRAAASSTTTGSGASGSHQLQVKMIEYQFVLPTHQLTPGTYTVTAANDGTIIHALTIMGPGVSATTPNVEPGASATLNVTFQKGSYDFFCPVPGHRQLGMETHVTVS